ncbi:hypothetical protein [Streptomyces sp. PTY087I2]|uniref:hypothetical protein n=1 Tax=Streptomyces sp. PTY087I2 TaxID=1819298 RepID=UPI00080BF8BB|nr:hypothetical protein [Streptomyces sp. PTY087I2]OCC07527.1 hypothetical protein A3Q37_06691 [Streptomyces sp. PTY087I2]
MPITQTLDLETLVTRMNAWASETDTKRGRLVRVFRSPKTNRPDLQAARLLLLIQEAESHA